MKWKGVILLLILVLLLPSAYSAQITESEFNQYQNITLNWSAIPTESEVYPYRLSVDLQTPINAGKLQTDCDDIVFVNDSRDILPHELVPLQCNTTTAEIYVGIYNPVDAMTIQWFYDNSSMTNQESTKVWNIEAKAVYHFENSSANFVNDSTRNNHTFELSTGSWNSTGLISQGVECGTGGCGNVSDSVDLHLSRFNVEIFAWSNTVAGGENDIIFNYGLTSNQQGLINLRDSTGNYSGKVAGATLDTPQPFFHGVWQYHSLQRNDSTVGYRLNTTQYPYIGSASGATPNDNMWLGHYRGGQALEGMLDGFRLWSEVRSEEWQTQTYNNMITHQASFSEEFNVTDTAVTVVIHSSSADPATAYMNRTADFHINTTGEAVEIYLQNDSNTYNIINLTNSTRSDYNFNNTWTVPDTQEFVGTYTVNFTASTDTTINFTTDNITLSNTVEVGRHQDNINASSIPQIYFNASQSFNLSYIEYVRLWNPSNMTLRINISMIIPASSNIIEVVAKNGINYSHYTFTNNNLSVFNVEARAMPTSKSEVANCHSAIQLQYTSPAFNMSDTTSSCSGDGTSQGTCVVNATLGTMNPMNYSIDNINITIPTASLPNWQHKTNFIAFLYKIAGDGTKTTTNYGNNPNCGELGAHTGPNEDPQYDPTLTNYTIAPANYTIGSIKTTFDAGALATYQLMVVYNYDTEATSAGSGGGGGGAITFFNITIINATFKLSPPAINTFFLFFPSENKPYTQILNSPRLINRCQVLDPFKCEIVMNNTAIKISLLPTNKSFIRIYESDLIVTTLSDESLKTEIKVQTINMQSFVPIKETETLPLNNKLFQLSVDKTKVIGIYYTTFILILIIIGTVIFVFSKSKRTFRLKF